MKTAEQLLKENFLLIENNKTCEAHTHLVVKQMIEFAKMHVKAAIKECIESAPSGSSSDTVSYLDVVNALEDCYPESNIK